MNYVFSSYIVIKEYDRPDAWLERTKAYNGILEVLAKSNKVIGMEQISYEGEVKKNGVQYFFHRFKNPGSRFPYKLHRFIKDQGPDVVVIQSLHFPLQVCQLRLLLGNRVKIIVHNHAEKPFKGLKKYALRVADRFTDAYLFASHELGADWVKAGNLASEKKVHEVMEVSSVFSPMDRALATAKTKVKEGTIFLWVGRLNPNKDPLTVVKAFLQFADHHEQVSLYMIYHTEELLAALKQVLAESPNNDAVTLIGQVPHDELQYWYNSADFILSGSHYEGSGTAVCEAMSCGCVPVVTNIASFRMITDKGRCGLLFEAGNEAELLTALQQTKQINLSASRTMALTYFESNLSFGAIARRIQEVVSSL